MKPSMEQSRIENILHVYDVLIKIKYSITKTSYYCTKSNSNLNSCYLFNGCGFRILKFSILNVYKNSSLHIKTIYYVLSTLKSGFKSTLKIQCSQLCTSELAAYK